MTQLWICRYLLFLPIIALHSFCSYTLSSFHLSWKWPNLHCPGQRRRNLQMQRSQCETLAGIRDSQYTMYQLLHLYFSRLTLCSCTLAVFPSEHKRAQLLCYLRLFAFSICQIKTTFSYIQSIILCQKRQSSRPETLQTISATIWKLRCCKWNNIAWLRDKGKSGPQKATRSRYK